MLVIKIVFAAPLNRNSLLKYRVSIFEEVFPFISQLIQQKENLEEKAAFVSAGKPTKFEWGEINGAEFFFQKVALC